MKDGKLVTMEISKGKKVNEMPTFVHAGLVRDCFNEHGADLTVIEDTFPGALSQFPDKIDLCTFWVLADYDAVFLMADVARNYDTWRWDGMRWEKV